MTDNVIIRPSAAPLVTLRQGGGAPVLQTGGSRVIVSQVQRTALVIQTSGWKGDPGPPGPPSAAADFRFQQLTALQVWVVNHNLGIRPSVEVLTLGYQKMDADITHPSLNQAVISFSTPQKGFARCS